MREPRGGVRILATGGRSGSPRKGVGLLVTPGRRDSPGSAVGWRTGKERGASCWVGGDEDRIDSILCLRGTGVMFSVDEEYEC